MTFAVRPRAAFLVVLTLLAAASPARAGFITYTFTSDSAFPGGSLTGSFRVEQADLADGVLSAGDVKNFSFTFTAPSGGTTQYVFSDVAPDIEVDPLTGVPTGLGGSVLGDQAGGGAGIRADLTSDALTPDASFWLATTQPTGESAVGNGHWEIGPEVNAVPAPAGAVLGLVGAGCLAVGRLLRRRVAAS
jgi:hypothetical protein